ncbi:hypothetical protein BV20DRAFT_918292, partial [Pilatotrama ljubarskyi]
DRVRVRETELSDDAVDEGSLRDANGAIGAVPFNGDTNAKSRLAEVGYGPSATQVRFE